MKYSEYLIEVRKRLDDSASAYICHENSKVREALLWSDDACIWYLRLNIAIHEALEEEHKLGKYDRFPKALYYFLFKKYGDISLIEAKKKFLDDLINAAIKEERNAVL